MDFGEFNDLIREVAGHDPARYDAVLDWPVRELLLAAVALRREVAREAYFNERLLYVLGGLKAPPEVPRILR